MRAIEGICKSSKLIRYYVGFTSLSVQKVKQRYPDWDQVVLLADRMKCKRALRLEANIQREISEWKGHEVYQRYHPDKMDDDGNIIIHESCGGKKGCNPCIKSCSVYMAWVEKPYR
jgi:hypothetical protein